MEKYIEKIYYSCATLKEKLEWSLTLDMIKEIDTVEERKLYKNIDGYKWTVRTREDSRHVPHFHIEKAGRTASFDILSGCLVKDECCNLSSKEIKIVEKWYKSNRIGLINLWNELHCDRKVEIV